ncbi:PQQ-binding-like beta-propeller repeat protein [Verrucomicrobia bacterium]|nr:PQQ-binding-like beta-propeller repeat protein [Verrucomicrobiota bacterium]
MKNSFLTLLFLLALTVQTLASEWNQWRGPQRNGVLPTSVPLASTWPADGPPLLWTSEKIPSNDDGGFSSVITAGNRAYVSVVWHRDVPTTTRAIDDLVLRKLGYRSTKSIGKELTAKMEDARKGLSPRLRGSKLEAWANDWVAANFPEKLQGTLGSWATGRFKKGKAAIDIEHLNTLQSISRRRFADQAKMEAWIADQSFPESVMEKVKAAVPSTRKQADDTVVCLDLASGKTVWKTNSPGEPTGRGSSSTPCVYGNHVIAIGSNKIHCLDAETGALQWSTPIDAKGPATSPLVLESGVPTTGPIVVFTAPHLTALKLKDGTLAWEQKKSPGKSTSPAIWSTGGKTYLIANSGKGITCVNPANGDIVWTAPGGGDSTPSISGNFMAVFCKKEDMGLSGYQLSKTGAKLIWSQAIHARRTQTSPLVHENHVYLMGADNHMCVDAATGEIKWSKKIRSNISSPILADGKIFVLGNNGSDLLMIKASPESNQELAKAKLRALWCPSPAITNGKLLLRHEDGIRCYDLQ